MGKSLHKHNLELDQIIIIGASLSKPHCYHVYRGVGENTVVDGRMMMTDDDQRTTMTAVTSACDDVNQDQQYMGGAPPLAS